VAAVQVVTVMLLMAQPILAVVAVAVV